MPRKSNDVRHVSRFTRSEEHTSELQSQSNLVCRLLLEKKNHAREDVPYPDAGLTARGVGPRAKTHAICPAHDATCASNGRTAPHIVSSHLMTKPLRGVV